jgi:hypothetical protein
VTIPAQPDIEAHVWAQLKDLPGVTSFTFAAIPMPLVPWQVAYSIQVDARADTKAAARERAEAARVIVWGLANALWDEGVITYVQITEGPFWNPDDDGSPHYVIRAEVRARPARNTEITAPVSPVAPMAAGRASGDIRERVSK